jgi:hypothetical protein
MFAGGIQYLSTRRSNWRTAPNWPANEVRHLPDKKSTQRSVGRFQMNITKLALSLLAGIATGCAIVPPALLVWMSDLPNCFDANYDKERGLFTIKNDVGNAANQQCLLTVGPRGDVASASRLTAGSYRVYLANGGGGGAGGTVQAFGGGGGGGGGAGAMDTQATVNLTEGVYKLTIGAGGPGGNACQARLGGSGGGPGWAGSASNIVRVATGEVVIGTPGADTYARPTRAKSERTAGEMDSHGGSGLGEASGGHGDRPATKDKVEDEADPGANKLASGRSGVGGAAGPQGEKPSGAGGGGGATSIGHGGAGGGESPGKDMMSIAPERGSLGSGGGGGEGSMDECAAGARGGHGYIALRPI